MAYFRLWGGAWEEAGIITAVDTVLPDAGKQARKAKDSSKVNSIIGSSTVQSFDVHKG